MTCPVSYAQHRWRQIPPVPRLMSPQLQLPQVSVLRSSPQQLQPTISLATASIMYDFIRALVTKQTRPRTAVTTTRILLLLATTQVHIPLVRPPRPVSTKLTGTRMSTTLLICTSSPPEISGSVFNTTIRAQPRISTFQILMSLQHTVTTSVVRLEVISIIRLC